MTVINFPGSAIKEELTQENKLQNIKEDLKKFEEYLEESQDNVDGVLMITFSNSECRHWISPGLSVADIYFMLSRIQNALLEYADSSE
jgi:hypothetical protein